MDPLLLEVLPKIGTSFFLLAIIIFISGYQHLGISKQMITAALRGGLQLGLLSSVLVIIFSTRSILLEFLILGVMVFFGAYTASQRLEDLPHVFRIELVALSVSVFGVMVTISLTGAIPINEPAIWIPIGGMAAGNSMNISYLTLNRIKAELDNRKEEVEAALCLGLTPDDVLSKLDIYKKSLSLGVTPSMNNLRTLGLVFIPGLMTGLLIGGTNPYVAAVYQVMIFFIIIASGLLASLISSRLLVNYLFT